MINTTKPTPHNTFLVSDRIEDEAPNDCKHKGLNHHKHGEIKKYKQMVIRLLSKKYSRKSSKLRSIQQINSNQIEINDLVKSHGIKYHELDFEIYDGFFYIIYTTQNTISTFARRIKHNWI